MNVVRNTIKLWKKDPVFVDALARLKSNPKLLESDVEALLEALYRFADAGIPQRTSG